MRLPCPHLFPKRVFDVIVICSFPVVPLRCNVGPPPGFESEAHVIPDVSGLRPDGSTPTRLLAESRSGLRG